MKFQSIPSFDSLSPQTTKGDLVGRTTTGAARFPVGANNTVLTADSSQALGVKWATGTIATVPTIQKFTSGTGTYSLPAGVLYIRVQAVGGGGGGGCSTPTSGGSVGGDTTFGSSLITCTGGALGTHQAAYAIAAGGTATATGLVGTVVNGAGGTPGNANSGNQGIAGASSFFGGAGAGGVFSSGNGGNAAANSGSGGGGAGNNGATNSCGGGGGAGAYVDVIITSPANSYSYAVGAAGTGEGGTRSGGNGGSGVIIVYEYYQ